MKNYFSKKILIVALLSTILLFLAACGDTDNAAEPENDSNETTNNEGTEESGNADEQQGPGGTIMWLSNLSSGVQYEGAVNYATMIAEELGYEFKVIYGDTFNDPAGNLNAVKNGMTNDVVAVIATQDGGLKDIMAEYPELYVAGYNTDMRSVYQEDGANAEIASNENFLGTIADGFTDGALMGKQYAEAVIDKNYKVITLMQFPEFAYPNLGEAASAFRAEIDAYNESASKEDQIEIIGETKVLEFAPLEESFFLEDGMNELDAIVAFLAGTDFVYPTLKTAIANGMASADTKLITGGFNNNEDIVADIGGEGVIQFLSLSPTDNMAWPLIMVDNALNEKMYADFSKSEALDSIPYVIDSAEDIENVVTKALTGTADPSLTQMPMEDVKEVLTRYNPDATYSELKELFQSEQLTVDALKNR